MKRNIHLFLNDKTTSIGEIRYDRQGSRENAAFCYSNRWLENNEKFSIDPALPLVPGFQFHKRHNKGSIFHGSIADTEPDGWGRRVILRDHAKRRSANNAQILKPSLQPLGELDFLLAVDDESRMGALRLCDEKGVFQGTSEEGERRTPPLLELKQLLHSSHAVEENTETSQDLAYLRGRGTSLGGLRPKCSLRDDSGFLAIGKFPSVSDERAVTKAEVLALTFLMV